MPIRVRFWWVRSVHLSGFAGALPGGSRPLASSNEPARKQARPVASAENKLLFHRSRCDHPPALSRLCIAARAGSSPSIPVQQKPTLPTRRNARTPPNHHAHTSLTLSRCSMRRRGSEDEMGASGTSCLIGVGRSGHTSSPGAYCAYHARTRPTRAARPTNPHKPYNTYDLLKLGASTPSSVRDCWW